ncbi:MAG: hypothetical protein J1F24_05710 [Oscillospiraceae bacterium]|nr:hypothetical protein [Oscillospiraceae bacterium]
MKKFISVLLVLFMLSFSVLPSFAAKSVELSASDNEVFAGDEFTVDIFISDYSQLKTATLIVQYDEKAVKFINLSVGAIVTAGSKAITYKNINNVGNSYVQIEYKDSSGALSSAGKFLSLTFVANDTATGETDIKLSVSGNKISTVTGSVTPEFKNGKVNIINNNPADSTKPAELPEESTSDVPETSDNPSDTSSNAGSAVTNSAESSSQNESDNSAVTVDKNEDKDKAKFNNNTYLIIAAAVTVVVILAVLLGGQNGKGTKKSKKRK